MAFVTAFCVVLAAAMLDQVGRSATPPARGITHDQDLTGATAKTVLGGSHLAGLALAFGLMVAVRRYIGPNPRLTPHHEKQRPKP
ncbi:hypothetical protein [Streptomyces sp. NPDC054888]